MRFHVLDLQIPSLSETVSHLEEVRRLIEGMSTSAEPFNKLLEWKVPKESIERVMVDTAYETFV